MTMFPKYVLALLIAVIANPAWAGDVLTADAARKAALNGEVVLVDIRTPDEWAETGVPDVAHQIDLRDNQFVAKLKALMVANPGKPIAAICATGGRSTYLTEALAKSGVQILNVREGMFGSKSGPGWLNRKLPTRVPDAPRRQ